MKNAQILLVFLIFIIKGYSKNHTPVIPVKLSHLGMIIKTGKKIFEIGEVITSNIGTQNNDSNEKALVILNKQLITLLLKDETGDLTQSDIKQIIEASDINIVYSENIRLYNWDTNLGIQLPLYSTISSIKDKKRWNQKLIGLYGVSENSFGDNLYYTNIFENVKNQAKFVLIMGQIKCGKICLINQCISFVNNGLELKRINGFKCINSSALTFEYFINSHIVEDLSFKVEGNKLIKYPIMNNEKTKVEGYNECDVNW